MSDYVREKVLRIPMDKLDLSNIKNVIASKEADYEDDFQWYLESFFPELFSYATSGMFQLAPTEEQFIDYVLEYEYDSSYGDWGMTRSLYSSEKEKYKHVFQQLDSNVNMDDVRLVEFCWYNCCEAPSYYDDTTDEFYQEV